MAAPRPILGLTCDEPFRSAAGKILWTRFEEMMSFRDAALEGSAGVYDMRVASRRLRAALEVFAGILPPKQLRPLMREVKLLADTLGRVRDLDVLLDRVRRDMKGRPPVQRLVLTDLIADLERRRDEYQAELRQILERLDLTGFSRRFLSLIARETT